MSSVIKRYDNQVPHSRVTKFNSLVHDYARNIIFLLLTIITSIDLC